MERLIFIMLLANTTTAQPLPPMPISITTNDEVELFSTTLTWGVQTGMTFRLVVGTNVVVTTGTTGSVWTTTGTFPLSIVATSGTNVSSATTTNLVVAPRTIVGVDLVAAASVLGPWMVTNPPPSQTNQDGMVMILPPQTNSADAGMFFKLRPWKDDRIWRDLK